MENAEESEDSVTKGFSAETVLDKPMQLCFGAFEERQIPIVKGPMSDSSRKRKIKAMKDLAQELSIRAKVQTILCIVSPNIPTRFLESYGDHADGFLYATESGNKVKSILKVATQTWIGTYAGELPEKKNQEKESIVLAEDNVTTDAARRAVQIAMLKAEEKRKRLQLIENQRKEKRNKLPFAKAKKIKRKSDTSKTNKDQRKTLPKGRTSPDYEPVVGTEAPLEIRGILQTNSSELLQEIEQEPVRRKSKKQPHHALPVNSFKHSLEKRFEDSAFSKVQQYNSSNFSVASANAVLLDIMNLTTEVDPQDARNTTDIAEFASTGFLQTARKLDQETVTTAREIFIDKLSDAVKARNEQIRIKAIAAELEPGEEPAPHSSALGHEKRLEPKWRFLDSDNEYSPPKKSVTKERKRFRIAERDNPN